MRSLIDTRDPQATVGEDAIEHLEALYQLPAREKRGGERRGSSAAEGSRRWPLVGAALTAGWLAFAVGIFFEPAPEPGAATPLAGELLVLGFWVALAGAAICAVSRVRRGAYALATIAGLGGIALAIACRTSGHHVGSWWQIELGATAALTGLAALGLVRACRGR